VVAEIPVTLQQILVVVVSIVLVSISALKFCPVASEAETATEETKLWLWLWSWRRVYPVVLETADVAVVVPTAKSEVNVQNEP
jgi:hypothetical protein